MIHWSLKSVTKGTKILWHKFKHPLTSNYTATDKSEGEGVETVQDATVKIAESA